MATKSTSKGRTETKASQSAARADDVWKLFKLGDEIVKALKGVSVDIAEGELACFMGPSGSGKSTLLHLLGGLERPTKGEISIHGHSLADLTESQLSLMRHQHVGFIFQSFNLIPLLTATENVELPLVFEDLDRKEIRDRAHSLLERVGLGHRLDHTPNKMSGGEQQRVAIARALVAEPKLLLADEPTGNLDSKTGDEIFGLIRSLARDEGTTIVMVTHDPTAAARADRVLTLKDGLVVSDARPERSGAA